MNFLIEKEFILKHIHSAIELYNASSISTKDQKTEFDIVTDIDKKIELYLIKSIQKEYPNDKIVSEETMSTYSSLSDRTWVIDPIDGTCNMANGMHLYGIQCALICNNKIVLSVIVLPKFNEEYYAIAGEGAYLNSKRIKVLDNTLITSSIVSFGDYSHSSRIMAKVQHNAIGFLFGKIAKIRMFGSAAIDFSFLSSNKTNSTVVMTSNIWDIIPGILLCQEAGAIVTNLENKPYMFGDYGVIASSDKSIHNLVVSSLLAKDNE